MNEAFYYRDGHDLVAMIHAVQAIFPFISGALLIGFYVYYWRIIQKDSLNYEEIDTRDWSTVAAYYLVSFYFTIFVFGLDLTGVVYQDNGTEFIIDNESIKNFVITPMVYDVLAVIFIVALFLISNLQLCSWVLQKCCCLPDCCSNVTNVVYKKWQLLCLGLAGFAPLLCIASHAPYIVIAWITGPSYAYGIGVFYAIMFFVYFFTFKLLYYICARYGCGSCCTESDGKFSYVALILPFTMGLILTGFFVMIACFVVLIPITESIEDASRQASVIYQAIIFVLGLFLAYLVFKPKENDQERATLSSSL